MASEGRIKEDNAGTLKAMTKAVGDSEKRIKEDNEVTVKAVGDSEDRVKEFVKRAVGESEARTRETLTKLENSDEIRVQASEKTLENSALFGLSTRARSRFPPFIVTSMPPKAPRAATPQVSWLCVQIILAERLDFLLQSRAHPPFDWLPPHPLSTQPFSAGAAVPLDDPAPGRDTLARWNASEFCLQSDGAVAFVFNPDTSALPCIVQVALYEAKSVANITHLREAPVRALVCSWWVAAALAFAEVEAEAEAEAEAG